MKLCKLLFVFFILFSFPTVFADEARIRTRDHLMVPNDVVVNDSNIEEILRTPSVDSKDKIYDYLNVLSSYEKDEIYKTIIEFQKISKLDCVIVLTNDLKGFEINQYAYHFYDYNDFSKEGIIFVIANIDSKKIFMGNIGDRSSLVYSIYTKDRTQEILKNTYKNIKIDNYYQAIKDYMESVKKYYESSNDFKNENNKDNSNLDFVLFIELFIISVSITFIVTLLIYNKVNKKMMNSHMKKVDSSTMNFTVISEQTIK